MDRDEAAVALDDVKQAMHDQFPDRRERLAQLDSHMATVAMIVSHLFTEDASKESVE